MSSEKLQFCIVKLTPKSLLKESVFDGKSQTFIMLKNSCLTRVYQIWLQSNQKWVSEKLQFRQWQLTPILKQFVFDEKSQTFKEFVFDTCAPHLVAIETKMSFRKVTISSMAMNSNNYFEAICVWRKITNVYYIEAICVWRVHQMSCDLDLDSKQLCSIIS